VEERSLMRIGIVFHKNPLAPPTGIDLVRLRAIATGLLSEGIEVEIIAPVEREGRLNKLIPVRTLGALDGSSRYDLVKTCYHHSITLIGKFKGPVVSRIVRVVDNLLPERDGPFREMLLHCQEMIKARASTVSLNNTINRDRWKYLYGTTPPTVLVPTGCPSTIPASMSNPFTSKVPAMLFLGSLAAPRMVHLLNEAARRLEGWCTIHLVGVNKASLYGGNEDCKLDPLVVQHGELPEDDVWDYISYSAIGLALATGINRFDNDLSKIFNYLRGGLPVLSEELVINNELIQQTGFGKIFSYGDIDALVSGVEQLLENPPTHKKQEVISFMVREHSWERRVKTYVKLFQKMLGGSAPV